MARETKVGLLAGLGFIICFAIILANRGPQTPVTTHQPYDVDSGVDTRIAAANTGSTIRQAPQRVTPAAVETSPVAPQRQAASKYARPSGPIRAVRSSADASIGPASSGGEVIPSSYPPRRTNNAGTRAGRVDTLTQRTASRPPAESSNPGRDSLAALTVPTGAPSLTAPSPDRAKRQRILQAHLDAIDAGRTQHTRTGREARQRPHVGVTGTAAIPATQRVVSAPAPGRAARPTESRRYTVVGGDTLSGIAQKHYGTRSAAVINAIFEANRHTLSSPDMLQVGAVLTLPTTGGSPRVSPAGPAPARQQTSTPDPTQSALRWYQIKKNDRYVSIAREQLGSASRWREIYELNKDKFPDAQRIRSGVRIKLPAGSATADAGSGR